MQKIRITPGMTRQQAIWAVELALLLGFQQESATFPVAGEDGTLEVPRSVEELKKYWTIRLQEPPADFVVPEQKEHQIFETDFRSKRGLETLFTKGKILQDWNQDMLPDHLDVRFVLPSAIDTDLIVACCNMAFRLGMETTSYQGGLAVEDSYVGNTIVFSKAKENTIFWQEEGEYVTVQVQGDHLGEFTSALCQEFPYMGGFNSWSAVLQKMIDGWIFRREDGQLAHLKALSSKEEALQVYAGRTLNEKAKPFFPEAQIKDYRQGEVIYQKRYEYPWEVDVFQKYLTKEVLPKVKKGETIVVKGALSEKESVRRRVEEYTKAKLEEAGAKEVRVEIVCAYKQGFSWLKEVVVPLEKKRDPKELTIYFKPYLAPGQVDWLDESGATPSYHNLTANTPQRWYDLPIRYLQELYPIWDVLVKELQLPEDKIQFLPYEGEEDVTYLVISGKEGEDKRRYTYKARTSERPYLDVYPNMGKVHPSTGYIEVWQQGEKIFDKEIPTDLERIWDTFQQEVLPECGRYIEEVNQGEISAELQPFFQKLQLEVWASEPDEPLESREDLLSSLDGFHEDLYFVGSDFFKNYGMEKTGEMMDAPGLILPVIHEQEGPPIFEVTLYQPKKPVPMICQGERILVKEGQREEVSLWAQSIYWEKTGATLVLHVAGVSKEVLAGYEWAGRQGLLEDLPVYHQGSLIRHVVLQDQEGNSYQIPLGKEEKASATKTIGQIVYPTKEVISYEKGLELFCQLQQVKGLEVFSTAESYTGRKLHAIWLRPQVEGYLSMTKRLTFHPSLMINARHHANEVSSTNASFMLLQELLENPKYKGLAKEMNIVLIPMENVDGTAIHYELQKEHPTWKLHVARFNAIGKEFYREHFKKDTIHQEAMGLTRLYEKYLPDILVDNHGVPSHEWEQQFSGYTSPSYKGFWLPRSLLYGYFWYVTNPEYKENYALNKEMEDWIAERIKKDEKMTEENICWSKQFERYAHQWMPKLFPANYYKNMINYWIPFEEDPKHRYPSIRYPFITSVAYTSEVADETAQGEYLHLCARAHVEHDLATIDMIRQASLYYEVDFVEENNKISARCQRIRPMRVQNGLALEKNKKEMM